jgi:hypothetical protein
MSRHERARGIAIAEGGAAADVARVAKMFFESEVRATELLISLPCLSSLLKL